MHQRSLLRGLQSLVGIFIFVFLALFTNFQPLLVHGASFTTNSVADTIDINPGDGVCADASGNCTLRAGITETNSLNGADILNVSAGNYVVSAPYYRPEFNTTSIYAYFTIFDNLEIRGAGSAITIISPQSNQNYSVFETFLYGDSKDNFTASGISISGSDADDCNIGFDFNPVGAAVLNDVVVEDCAIGVRNTSLQRSSSDNSYNNSVFKKIEIKEFMQLTVI